MGSLKPETHSNQDLDDSGCVQDASVTENGYKGQKNILELSDDVLLYILRFCPPRDLKALGHTCPRLGALVCDRTLWTKVDARSSPVGQERLRWYLNHCLSNNTTELKLTGYVNKNSRCLGIQDLNWPRDYNSGYLRGSIGSTAGVDVEHFLLRMWYPHLPRYAASPRWPDEEVTPRRVTCDVTRRNALDAVAMATSVLDTCMNALSNNGENDIVAIPCDAEAVPRDPVPDLFPEVPDLFDEDPDINAPVPDVNVPAPDLNAVPLNPIASKPKQSANASDSNSDASDSNSNASGSNTKASGSNQNSADPNLNAAASVHNAAVPNLQALVPDPNDASGWIPILSSPTVKNDYASVSMDYAKSSGMNTNLPSDPEESSQTSDDSPKEFGDQITKVCFGPQFTLSSSLLRELRTKCSLTSLSLEYCNIDYKSTNLRHFPPNLKKLSLRGTRCYNLPLNTSFLCKIHDRLPELEVLDVSECDWFEPASLMPLSKVPKLRELYMKECKRLTECVAYASLAARYGFRELRICDFRGSPVADSEVSALGWLPNLEELYCAPPDECDICTEHSHSWKEKLPKFQELDLWEIQEPDYYKNITPEPVEPMDEDEDEIETAEPPLTMDEGVLRRAFNERRVIVIQPNENEPEVGEQPVAAADRPSFRARRMDIFPNGSVASVEVQPSAAKRAAVENLLDLAKRARREEPVQMERPENRFNLPPPAPQPEIPPNSPNNIYNPVLPAGPPQLGVNRPQNAPHRCRVKVSILRAHEGSNQGINLSCEREHQAGPNDRSNLGINILPVVPGPQAVQNDEPQGGIPNAGLRPQPELNDRPNLGINILPSESRHQPVQNDRPPVNAALRPQPVQNDRPPLNAGLRPQPVQNDRPPVNAGLRPQDGQNDRPQAGPNILEVGPRHCPVHDRPRERVKVVHMRPRHQYGQIHWPLAGPSRPQPVVEGVVPPHNEERHLQFRTEYMTLNIEQDSTFFTPNYLLTDSAIIRFGRADNDNVNYVHLGRVIQDNYLQASGSVRPDRSNLRVLSVTGYRNITDRSLQHLASAAPHLRLIDFSETNVTPRGVAIFKALQPNCEVIFSKYTGK